MRCDVTSILTLRNPALWLSLLLIAGCGSDSPTAPTTDFIALDSIVPAAGTALTAGDRVTFTAVVTCTIVSGDSGVTAMVLQDLGNRTLLGEGEIQPQAALQKGTATITLSHTITVPRSGSTVVVMLPIFVNSTTTSALVRREYAVR
jgi:hypothetical protein